MFSSLKRRVSNRRSRSRRQPHLQVEGTPTVGVVVLTMGQRPAELDRALRSLLRQKDVNINIAVVGNGWEPVGLPPGVKGVKLEENLGIPAGRNAGVEHVHGEYLMFLDDDSWLLDKDFVAEAVERFRRYPSMGVLQPQIVDPAKPDQSPRRWTPRIWKRTPDVSSNVFHVGETCLVMPRHLFDETGGWAGGFWYAHEGIELAWRIWDTGHRVWYAGDMRVGHPVVDARRHKEFYRLNARNRVWLARRNLRPPFRWIYPMVWALGQTLRMRKDPRGLQRYWEGYRSGWEGSPWYHQPRPPLKWSTHLRMALYGRPPFV